VAVFLELVADFGFGCFIGSAGGYFYVSYVYGTPQEGAAGQDDGFPLDLFPARGFDSANLAVFDDQSGHGAFMDLQPLLPRDDSLHSPGVSIFVALNAVGLNGRAFPCVEDSELDSGVVRIPGHFSPERIELEDDMGLGHPADGRIAGHTGDSAPGEGDQEGFGAQFGCGERGFAPGMTCTHNDYVKGALHFPMQKVEKI
jgi:hypothetical protein